LETQKENYVSNQGALFPFTHHKMTNTQRRKTQNMQDSNSISTQQWLRSMGSDSVIRRNAGNIWKVQKIAVGLSYIQNG
jgi:hypothetical protein